MQLADSDDDDDGINDDGDTHDYDDDGKDDDYNDVHKSVPVQKTF